MYPPTTRRGSSHHVLLSLRQPFQTQHESLQCRANVVHFRNRRARSFACLFCSVRPAHRHSGIHIRKPKLKRLTSLQLVPAHSGILRVKIEQFGHISQSYNPCCIHVCYLHSLDLRLHSPCSPNPWLCNGSRSFLCVYSTQCSLFFQQIVHWTSSSLLTINLTVPPSFTELSLDIG